MKKLYQGKGRRVHPAPADAAAAAAAVALPAAVLALASALTAEEQEVLAYLLSGGGAAPGGRRRHRGAHPPEMVCGCFSCYKSFWVRWDASPNRHVIHRIIDAVEEEGGGGGGNTGPPRRPPRRRRRGRRGSDDACEEAADDAGKDADANVEHTHHQGCDRDVGEDGDYEGDGDDEEEEEVDSMDGDADDAMSDCSNGGGNTEKSTVGRLVRFIGEKVWAAWN